MRNALAILTPIPRGEPGILQTVDMVRRVIVRDRVHPAVRAAAVAAISRCSRTNDVCKARAIVAWVVNHLRFVKDPVDTELVHTPSLLAQTIQRTGSAAGDCDDGAALVGALDQSIGLRSRLVVGSFRADRALHHVWSEAYIESTRSWLVQDPFRAERFDVEPTRIQIVGV